MSYDEERVHALPAAGKLRRSLSRWRVFAFVALAIAILALIGRFALPDSEGGEDHIARINVDGVITTDPARVAELKAIEEDDTVKAVIVSINSPGGTTAGGEELYESLGRLRETKPVVATIDELGASAAYMTAIATDRILARRLSIVGSIGVLYQHMDAGKLLDTIGIDYQKVQTGPLKAEPDIDEPLTGAPRASLQALVDDSFEWFVDIVAERRNLPRPETLELSDGRVVTGRVALESGLIDALGGEAEAVAWLQAEKGVTEDLPVYTHYPMPLSSTERLLRFVGSEARTALGLEAGGAISLDGLVSLWQANSTR